MADVLALCENKECLRMRPGDGDAGGGTAAGPVVITASVGYGGVNRIDDVRSIQNALNSITPGEGGASPKLVPSGVCDQKTKDAIQKFQIHHFGWSKADGRVDPGYRTHKRLNLLVSHPPVPEQRLARVVAHIGDALSCVRAAQSHLLWASTETTLSSREERMARVNRHFDVDGWPASKREMTLQRIALIYDRMMQAFARPGNLWGQAIFDIDKWDTSALAYTVAGGFFLDATQTDTINGVTQRQDAIYLCNKLDKFPDEACVIVIIHELAHFVGPQDPSPDAIGDYAYTWYDNPRMQRLTPRQKLTNAQCYANFAFDVKYNRKPAGW
jgi:hypothetical protein